MRLTTDVDGIHPQCCTPRKVTGSTCHVYFQVSSREGMVCYGQWRNLNTLLNKSTSIQDWSTVISSWGLRTEQTNFMPAFKAKNLMRSAWPVAFKNCCCCKHSWRKKTKQKQKQMEDPSVYDFANMHKNYIWNCVTNLQLDRNPYANENLWIWPPPSRIQNQSWMWNWVIRPNVKSD